MHQPGHAVEELQDVPLHRDVGPVAYDNGGNVQCKQAVTEQQRGDTVGEETDAQDHHGVQCVAGKLDALQDPLRPESDSQSDQETYRDLHEQHPGSRAEHGHGAGVLGGGQDLHEDDREHVSHGVVASGLQLQHRAEVLPEVHPLAAQHREHRCRVRRGHDCGKKETAQERSSERADPLPGDEIDEKGRQHRGQQDAQSRKQRTLSHHRLRLAHRCLQTAREQDDGHGEMADGLSDVVILELQSHSVGPDDHTQQKEQQQGRSPEARSDLGDQYGEEHQYRCQEQQVVGQQVDGKD